MHRVLYRKVCALPRHDCGIGKCWSRPHRSPSVWVVRSGRSVLLIEQFDFLHRRGSSHGDSRITRKTYMQEHYVALMVRRVGPGTAPRPLDHLLPLLRCWQTEAYQLWDEIERESKVKLYTKTGGVDVIINGSEQMRAVQAHLAKHKVRVAVVVPLHPVQRFRHLRWGFGSLPGVVHHV
jgi:sarcosine oxidase/L-pipecolate oxidase